MLKGASFEKEALGGHDRPDRATDEEYIWARREKNPYYGDKKDHYAWDDLFHISIQYRHNAELIK
jgi:hypothetical protein